MQDICRIIMALTWQSLNQYIAKPDSQKQISGIADIYGFHQGPIASDGSQDNLNAEPYIVSY